MESEPTRGWWLTRIELAIGIGAALVAVLVFVSMPRAFGEADITPGRVLAAAGLVAMAVGLIWMIRIFRDPSDVPPPWRYRNR